MDVKGEILELKNTINTMVDQLNAFAAEVTRVAREVGTEGKLGGQAQVPGVAGTWKDLTDNVNVMAANLTEQVRGIVKVVTAVANGDLTQKLTVNAKGEVAALAETINNMTDTLATFADQVTTVAREVGVEGRLGGQANVPGAAGTWKDLTGNVNLLADNLTNQVRAIAEVATAVTKGDLTRSIQVEASGEVAELKDNINTMIDNLRLTTDRNTEQDWLKTNLARFTGMLQGQRELTTVGRMLLSELAPLVNAQQGVIYQMEAEESGEHDRCCPPLRRRPGRTSGAIRSRRGTCRAMRGREAAHADHRIATKHRRPSGPDLFEAIPRNVIVLPVLFEDRVKAVIELATLSAFTASHLAFLEQLTASIGIVLNSIEATMQTEGLLKQSQQLATELQTQQKELQQTNEQLAQKAQQLAEQNAEVERKNQEIEQARRALEEKAKELALTSKYKSEFLANMSHELRTPLNSILVLGQQLAENPDGNLTPKQVEFARTIHGAGTDLLNLISDILDLSKIESGTVSVEAEEVFFGSLLDMVARPFRHEAENRRLDFRDHHRSAPGAQPGHRFEAPAAGAQEPAVQCLQIHRTGQGAALGFSSASSGWSADHPILSGAGSVIAFEVTDTGIGIPSEKQRIIFEAFQQADAGTSRKYGGTGLGLAISRELASLLGGEIQLKSTPGKGSTFTLYLPQTYVGPAAPMSCAGREQCRISVASLPVQLWRRPSRIEHGFEDDRENLQEGDAVLAHRRRRSALCACALRSFARQGIQGAGGAYAEPKLLRLRGSFIPTAISLDVFLPDMLGWTVLNHLEAGSSNPPYSRSDADSRRRPASWPFARSLCICHQANHDRRTGGRTYAHSRILAAAAQAAAGGRRQSGRAD